MRGGIPRSALMVATAMAGLVGAGADLSKPLLPEWQPPQPQRTKPGKSHHSGKGGPRPNGTTDWKGLATQARESERRVRQGRAGDDREWRKRMAWNETVYQRVLEHQAEQRAHRDGRGRPVPPHRSGGLQR